MQPSSEFISIFGSFMMAVSTVTLLLIYPLVDIKAAHIPTLLAELNAFT